METEKQRIEELVKQLNAASAAYYNGQDEIMPNYEWDALFDELTTLEEKTGYIIKDSPTQNAGYEESGSGQKNRMSIRHFLWRRPNRWKNCSDGRELIRSGCHGNWTDLRWF